MKIIFVDIDGVLTSSKSVEDMMMGKSLYPFDRDCVEQLNRILVETGAEIVISSSWRKHYEFIKLQGIFAKQGIKKRIKDYTVYIDPELPSVPDNVKLEEFVSIHSQYEDNIIRTREKEIKKYVSDHNDIENWCALDDFPMSGLSPNMMQTVNRIGLTKDNADMVIDILNGANK